MEQGFLNIAHRGFSGQYPENTIIAFRAALELGCTWLECDVRRTRDGCFVVIHDQTVDRTTNGTGRVDSLTWNEIMRLDAGSWKDPKFSGERVPLLDKLLTLVSGQAQLVIELKVGKDSVPGVVSVVSRHCAFGWTVASAFEWEVLETVRREAPRWRTTWLTTFEDLGPDEAINRCVDAGVDTIAPRASLIDVEFVREAHAAGLLVRAWGVADDTGPGLRRLIAAGVDGATTNHPNVLNEMLNKPLS
ncbi:MAG TPA: glycerophosphodiester phosphodiesterase family protein [Candidatus Latescibacteria bacterium]|nr:glycerophosphodiester phosphodiesterase family protein [Candidatus Latescibacterota bacterium]HOF62049.1 glycerophosphodiester phosphodiesterase family protein [Candidatus Latescibacterota bacterium]HOS64495.1 glycerophosphodiester phosphodiesterase family protein [Candidatus Latescibacterota bacterium]HPK74030.1 glycerophosphodiester phosphodiesterase family protein [Candidatus Latescibacterota bacterium]